MISAARRKILLRKYSVATWLIIFINIIFYLYICAQSGNFLTKIIQGPGYDALIQFGAKENGLIASGQLQRLFLPMFMHANLVHLLVNMFGLWSIGRIFEIIAGPRNFFILYIVSGLTGNFCSFALLPQMSVGASGSLFGILLCLFIIQKYEERLSKQFKRPTQGMQFGTVLFVNVVLNIIFGFSFPIFDWACHLGGALAGILFGFALTTRHKWNLKFILSSANSKHLKKKFFERHRIYYIGIFLLNVLFLMSFFNIKKYQIIYGIAIESASENKNNVLSYDDLSQYENILVSQNEETNPENMLIGAVYLHSNGFYFAAVNLYEVLLTLSNESFGSEKFISDETKRILNLAIDLAKSDKRISPEIENYVEKLSGHLNLKSEICAKPAALYMTLGFFQISGKLYECAYALNLKNEDYAQKALESFHLADDMNGINQILSLVKIANLH
ncbi:rhomboid family intramembrane serine protease [Fluviispira multicolorata]|uniref:Rhomboid family intramembrane serine protease n=1 Tax=Fluviispira multicolorata TaxID=2654512 RepID=A0A833N4R0_9BACT|nr:rhomboid family intramembrane serine protease [Fluviispira multicolorata]KAB8028549.1 rhomboid family intramembrane serine protease [Fluviispira multicolorata]